MMLEKLQQRVGVQQIGAGRELCLGVLSLLLCLALVGLIGAPSLPSEAGAVPELFRPNPIRSDVVGVALDIERSMRDDSEDRYKQAWGQLTEQSWLWRQLGSQRTRFSPGSLLQEFSPRLGLAQLARVAALQGERQSELLLQRSGVDNRVISSLCRNKAFSSQLEVSGVLLAAVERNRDQLVGLFSASGVLGDIAVTDRMPLVEATSRALALGCVVDYMKTHRARPASIPPRLRT